jgi:hypothetical protein
MSSGKVYQLKIQLKGSKPPIWRRIHVPGRVSLAELHPIILAAMGWYGGHLYAFWVGQAEYGISDPELGIAEEILPPDYDPAHFDLDRANRRLSNPGKHLVLLDTP